MKRQTDKKVKIVFADEKTHSAYLKLKNSRFAYERKMHSLISEAIGEIKTNPFCGVEVPHKLIPREYFRKYGVDNLWKYNLSKEWRLIYSNIGDDVQILSVILEWFDSHKKYERRFGY
ncbi:MAG: hypothetical protein ABIH83_05785 [Candidatus Micrarchaeota archaeon]